MEKTKVIILGTIHGLHRDNNHYSYEKIFDIIDDFSPDVIGVEIREEDIYQPQEYLKEYYPTEMIETKLRYEGKCNIYGFDWFEEGIEEKLIPEGYFDNLEKVNLEKALALDDQYIKERKLLEVIEKMRYELVVNHTADEVNNGRYDLLTKIYYEQFGILFKNTPYQRLYKFYIDRDKHIDKNILDIIEKNQGKKIILLMGLDHRVYAIESILGRFKEGILFTNIGKCDE